MSFEIVVVWVVCVGFLLLTCFFHFFSFVFLNWRCLQDPVAAGAVVDVTTVELTMPVAPDATPRFYVVCARQTT